MCNTQATHNRYSRAARAGTRLEQVLLPATSTDACGLQRVMMASYDVDIEWLESIFPPDIPITYIGNPPPAYHGGVPAGLYRSDLHANWEMAVPYKPHARALQHMKFLLLFFDTHVRVVISTGNLTPLDWSRYENVRIAWLTADDVYTGLSVHNSGPCLHLRRWVQQLRVFDTA